MSTLLQTTHGSHLYGLARPDSDLDTYRVVSIGRTYQATDGLNDVTEVELSHFVAQVLSGVPQALEALYSPFKWVDYRYAPLFSSLRPDFFETRAKYRRTINNFVGWGADNREATPKRRAHAVRLAINWGDFAGQGCFNPRLNETQRYAVLWAREDAGYVINTLAALGFCKPNDPTSP